MIEKRSFQGGGMDQDSSIEDIAPNDYVEAFQIRTTGTSAGEAGDATNIESNALITGTRPTGINKGIGANGFERTRKGYGFVFNSDGYHLIVQIDYDTEVQTVVFTNKTDSGGLDVLPLNPQYYVNDIKLINGILFPFTDDNMQPCCINLERLIASGYGTLTADDFLLIKAQPLKLVEVTYNDDESRSVNLLKNKLFQFASYYTYLDDEDSALSSHSKRIVPTNEPTPSFGTDVSKSNNIIVKVNIGDNRVKILNVAAIIGGQTVWFVIKSITRTEILALPDTEVDVTDEIYQAYNPATNIYSFAFYNDGNYNNLDVLFTDLQYDNVPIKCGSLEVINGSILALADITLGYNRPEIGANLSVAYYDPGINNVQPDPSVSLRVSGTTNVRIRGSHRRRVTITYAGTAKTGDEFVIQVQDIRDGTTVTYNYTVLVAQDGNTAGAVQKLSTVVPNSSVSGTTLTFKTDSYYELKSAYVVLQNAGTGVSASIHSIKLNSSYQLALALYDKWGRELPIITDSRFVIKTQSYAQTQGLIPKIVWGITGTPPVEAVSYQWLITKNGTHQTDLYMNAILDDTLTGGDYFVLKINSLLKFNETNSSSILTYDYSPGDRCTFLFYDNSGTTVWFDAPAIDVEVVAFDIVVDTVPDPDVTNYLLKVRKSSSLSAATITGKTVMLEIYTPTKRVTTTDGVDTLATTLFYEIGERYDIVAGAYSVLNGELSEADAYFKTRELVDAVDPNVLKTYLVEDFNFSDFYQSNYNSYGRPRLYNDVQRQIRKMASICYSDQFLEGSLINGINRFFPERIYGDNPGETSSNYGAINKIRQIGNYLVCIQDTKTGSIPINISIIEDQTADQNVAVSDRLLNYIRYSSAGTFGMGGAKESYAERPDGTIYFVDPNNSLPIRIGRDGTSVISGKMTKFFRATLQAAKVAGRKIIGVYDIFNDEYIVSIEQGGDVVTSFVFSAANWKFEDDYTIAPGGITITTAPTKGIVTYNSGTGIATYTANAGTSGADFFVQSFNPGTGVVTKRTCITIVPGDITPEPFYFIDLTGVELSTLTESNSVLIDGINIPTPISISAGGEYSINGGAWTSVAGTVVNEDTVEVRQTSSASTETTTDVTLTVGTYSDTFSITTKDAAPDPFTFIDVINAMINSLYTSNTVTITGITGSIPISITGGEYQIGSGSWTSSPGTITNGQTVKVRQTSSGSYLTPTNTTLTVGSYSDTYTVTTANNIPDAFAFVDVIDKEVSTVYTSNTVTITGAAGSYPISIVDGEYQISAGAWTSASGTITSGQTVKVRRTSSSSYSTTVGTTLTVGGTSDTYSITTRVAVNVTVNYAMSFGLDPVTPHWNVIERIRGGVTTTIATIQSNTSGTLPAGDFKEGDTLNVYQGSYPAFMWAPTSQVNLDINVDAVDYFSGNTTTQGSSQASTPYVIAPGVVVIDIASTGSSTAVGYVTENLRTENYLLQDELGVTISDNDEAGLGITDVKPGNGTSNFSFNVKGTTGLLTVTVNNYKATAIDYSVAGEGGYIRFGTIAGLGSAVHNDVTKGGVTVEASDNNGAVACGVPTAYTGGQTYPTIIPITLGTGLGTVTLTYDAYSVPDKFIFMFDGVEVMNTGYRGSTSQQAALDAALATYGAPSETITAPGSGTTNFVKSTATTVGYLYVYAPMGGTVWDATISCPV